VASRVLIGGAACRAVIGCYYRAASK